MESFIPDLLDIVKVTAIENSLIFKQFLHDGEIGIPENAPFGADNQGIGIFQRTVHSGGKIYGVTQFTLHVLHCFGVVGRDPGSKRKQFVYDI